MQPLRLGAIIYNISVSLGGKVTHLTDSSDVLDLPTPANTKPSSNTLITTLKIKALRVLMGTAALKRSNREVVS